MPDTMLHLWEFEEAPANLQRLVPRAYTGGWLVFVCPGSDSEIVDGLVSRCNKSGFSVLRYEVADGGIVLAGPHRTE